MIPTIGESALAARQSALFRATARADEAEAACASARGSSATVSSYVNKAGRTFNTSTLASSSQRRPENSRVDPKGRWRVRQHIDVEEACSRNLVDSGARTRARAESRPVIQRRRGRKSAQAATMPPARQSERADADFYAGGRYASRVRLLESRERSCRPERRALDVTAPGAAPRRARVSSAQSRADQQTSIFSSWRYPWEMTWSLRTRISDDRRADVPDEALSSPAFTTARHRSEEQACARTEGRSAIKSERFRAGSRRRRGMSDRQKQRERCSNPTPGLQVTLPISMASARSDESGAIG